MVLFFGNASSQISIKVIESNGKRTEVPIDSICSISKSSLYSKALRAINYPDIKEKEYLGYAGIVQYDFTFTSTNLLETKLAYGFSTNYYQNLDFQKRPHKMDSLLFKEHERAFQKVKKYLKLQDGKTYVMRISIKFEWDEKNDKSVEKGDFLIDKKYQIKGIHDKNAKC